jgi:hypothetical protein
MLTATVTGGLTSRLMTAPEGHYYCTIYSEEARRSIRALVRNHTHAALIEKLPKHARLTVSGQLRSKGAIGPAGQTLAYLTIVVQTMKIHGDY